MILGICGSPRDMATAFVLKKCLEMLEERGLETEYFSVKGREIGFCRHCDYCLRNEECVIQDDMQALYPLLRDARGVIMATPVYNGGLSAQLKSVMDRCRALLAEDPDALRFKVGMAVAVGGDRIGGQELAAQQIINFYIINGMIPVSGGFFGANLGATFWSKDTLEDVKKDEEGFRSLRKTTNRFTTLIKDLSIVEDER